MKISLKQNNSEKIQQKETHSSVQNTEQIEKYYSRLKNAAKYNKGSNLGISKKSLFALSAAAFLLWGGIIFYAAYSAVSFYEESAIAAAAAFGFVTIVSAGLLLAGSNFIKS